MAGVFAPAAVKMICISECAGTSVVLVRVRQRFYSVLSVQAEAREAGGLQCLPPCVYLLPAAAEACSVCIVLCGA